MPLDLPAPDAVQITLTIATPFLIYVAVVKAALPIWRWCGRVANGFRGIVAVGVGRDPYIDPATGKPVPRVPSLVNALGEIRDTQTEQGKSINKLTNVVEQVANQQATLSEHTRQLNELRLTTAIHTEQIGMLKAAAVERTAIHQENTSLFDMVGKRDSEVIDPQEEP